MESTYVLLFLVNSEIELSYYWTIVAWKRSVLLASSRAGSRCSCGREQQISRVRLPRLPPRHILQSSKVHRRSIESKLRWGSQGPSKPHRESFSMDIPARPTMDHVVARAPAADQAAGAPTQRWDETWA